MSIEKGFRFQGKAVQLKLKVHSSFAQDMRVDTLAAVPPDPRFSFALEEGAIIASGKKNSIGVVSFDPGAACRAEEACYAGFPAAAGSKRELFFS